MMLTGCFAAPPTTGGGTGGSGQSGSSDGTDGGNTSTDPGTDTGTTDFSGKPATFPGDIPLIGGDVVFGVDLGTGWTVVIPVTDVQAAYADASAQLQAAGFEALTESTSTDGSFGAFKNDTYQVQVTATDTGEYGLAVSYVVVLLG